MIATAKVWAKGLQRDVIALRLAARDPRTPLAAKLVAGAVAAYALSPIDLIPDVIPVLGLLDDLLIVPLGILWAIRLIPPPPLAEFRALAAAHETRPQSRFAAGLIILLWIAWPRFVSDVFAPPSRSRPEGCIGLQ